MVLENKLMVTLVRRNKYGLPLCPNLPDGFRRVIPQKDWHRITSYLQINFFLSSTGKTLYETLLMQNVDIGPMSNVGKPETKRSDTWYEPTFGEGPTSGYDHVILSGNGVDTAARVNYAEQENLEDYWEWDELFDGSRLASCIELTKEMDGMIVYVPPRVADNCP